MSAGGERRTGAAPLDWTTWRDRWPNAGASRFVDAAGLRWHVQQMGRGPVALLVHGTAGATHAWHAIGPRLAERFTVVAADLPGHGFTDVPPAERLTLPRMAADLAALLAAIGARPRLVVGHSAGAAILLRMALDGALPDTRLLVGLNAAIVPPSALYQALSVPRLGGLFTGATVARLVARFAVQTGVTETMLRSTGSRVPRHVAELYDALTGSEAHVRTALTMMAQWDVPALLRDVHRLRLPALFLAGAEDRWVPPRHARAVAASVPGARFEVVEGHGHLMHEEAGDELGNRLLRAAQEADLHGGNGGDVAHEPQPPGAR